MLHINHTRFMVIFRAGFTSFFPMTDITPIDAIDELYAKGGTEHSLLTDISHALGLESGKSRSERWKKKLREELVREHIAAEQKKDATSKSFFHKLFKKG